MNSFITKKAIIVIGIGEMSGVFTRGLLRAGYPLIPITRDMDINEVARQVEDPEMVLVAVGESDLGPLLEQIPLQWKNKVALLPGSENADINPVGGPGKEFWVFGENFENEPSRGRDPAGERGAWRIEITPSVLAEEDYFLNVMQVMDNDYESQLEVELIKGDKVVGAQIGERVVIFSEDAEVMNTPFSFTIEGKDTYDILLTDMAEGTWQVLKDGNVLIPAISVPNENGTLYFKAKGGEYNILRFFLSIRIPPES